MESNSKPAAGRQVDYSSLFEMKSARSKGALELSAQSTDSVGIYLFHKVFFGELQPPQPIVFRAWAGDQADDFLWSHSVTLFCVSQRVIELLLENRFTGWATYPVKVYDTKGKHLPHYHGFAVKSSAGEQDYRRCEIVTKPPLSKGGQPYRNCKGMYFDESRWDGSDIFRVQYTTILVTRQVQQAFEKAGITNVRFSPALDYQVGEAYAEMVMAERTRERGSAEPR